MRRNAGWLDYYSGPTANAEAVSNPLWNEPEDMQLFVDPNAPVVEAAPGAALGQREVQATAAPVVEKVAVNVQAHANPDKPSTRIDGAVQEQPSLHGHADAGAGQDEPSGPEVPNPDEANMGGLADVPEEHHNAFQDALNAPNNDPVLNARPPSVRGRSPSLETEVNQLLARNAPSVHFADDPAPPVRGPAAQVVINQEEDDGLLEEPVEPEVHQPRRRGGRARRNHDEDDDEEWKPARGGRKRAGLSNASPADSLVKRQRISAAVAGRAALTTQGQAIVAGPSQPQGAPVPASNPPPAPNNPLVIPKRRGRPPKNRNLPPGNQASQPAPSPGTQWQSTLIEHGFSPSAPRPQNPGTAGRSSQGGNNAGAPRSSTAGPSRQSTSGAGSSQPRGSSQQPARNPGGRQRSVNSGTQPSDNSQASMPGQPSANSRPNDNDGTQTTPARRKPGPQRDENGNPCPKLPRTPNGSRYDLKREVHSVWKGKLYIMTTGYMHNEFGHEGLDWRPGGTYGGRWVSRLNGRVFYFPDSQRQARLAAPEAGETQVDVVVLAMPDGGPTLIAPRAAAGRPRGRPAQGGRGGGSSETTNSASRSAIGSNASTALEGSDGAAPVGSTAPLGPSSLTNSFPDPISNSVSSNGIPPLDPQSQAILDVLGPAALSHGFTSPANPAPTAPPIPVAASNPTLFSQPPGYGNLPGSTARNGPQGLSRVPPQLTYSAGVPPIPFLGDPPTGSTHRHDPPAGQTGQTGLAGLGRSSVPSLINSSTASYDPPRAIPVTSAPGQGSSRTATSYGLINPAFLNPTIGFPPESRPTPLTTPNSTILANSTATNGSTQAPGLAPCQAVSAAQIRAAQVTEARRQAFALVIPRDNPTNPAVPNGELGATGSTFLTTAGPSTVGGIIVPVQAPRAAPEQQETSAMASSNVASDAATRRRSNGGASRNGGSEEDEQ